MTDYAIDKNLMLFNLVDNVNSSIVYLQRLLSIPEKIEKEDKNLLLL